MLERPRLESLAHEMTEIGDLWRRFALLGARRCKGRDSAENTFAALAEMVRECAQRERSLFNDLLRVLES